MCIQINSTQLSQNALLLFGFVVVLYSHVESLPIMTKQALYGMQRRHNKNANSFSTEKNVITNTSLPLLKLKLIQTCL